MYVFAFVDVGGRYLCPSVGELIVLCPVVAHDPLAKASVSVRWRPPLSYCSLSTREIGALALRPASCLVGGRRSTGIFPCR